MTLTKARALRGHRESRDIGMSTPVSEANTTAIPIYRKSTHSTTSKQEVF